ncbi:hypothetical protein [Sphingobacterium endophyticum]|uniref:hypothetical protein n=1 Tax=Sphingobacterium endophyticum TaxID=2546448 RepID=UPI0012E0DD3D|nr:hypothetical protein [Sphingobacterium endophyticum]
MTFEINTLHRGRFIWILLGSLFVVGYLLSLTQLQEIYKIIILLFCIPAIMWAAVRFSKDNSTWSIQNRNINITIFNKELSFAVDDISYIKNHIRSGGNLVVFHKKGKSSPTRIWRNKIFASNDQFDELIAALKVLEIEILIG